MPVVYAALVPNSPLLLPGINEDIKKGVSKTLVAYSKLSRILKSSKAEIIFIISSLNGDENKFCLYQDKTFKPNIKEYGDLVTSFEIKGAIGFTHSLKEFIGSQFNIPLSTPRNLPIEIAIPLMNLGLDLPVSPMIIPNQSSASEIMTLSRIIFDYINSLPVKIAVIGCGLLSINKRWEISEDQKILNNIFIKILNQGDYENLNNIEQKLRLKNNESLITPATFIYNIIPGNRSQTAIIASETSQGITHLAANISW
ncbi:MAG: hypothetical protein V1712_01375 [Patescibacteria group bacterium]